MFFEYLNNFHINVKNILVMKHRYLANTIPYILHLEHIYVINELVYLEYILPMIKK